MTDGFMPHGFCLRWDSPLLFVFILGNLGVAIAYFTIPIALRKFIGKRADLPYTYMFKLFAAFILSCGVTHLIKIWTLYQPVYWIEAVADLLTAAVSLLTAFLLIPIIPKALALRGPKELEDLNRELFALNSKLKNSEEELQVKVDKRTAELDLALEHARQSEEQFRNLVDGMPQLAWAAEPDGSISYYNRGWYEYTGTTFDQMHGWGWDKVHDPKILPLVVEQWQHSLDSGTPFEMEFPLRRWDGQFRWFLTRVNPSVDKNGKIIRWIGINTDIDDQKQSAEVLERRVEERTRALRETNDRLAESESKFRAIFDQTFELIGLLSSDGVVLEINKTGLEFQDLSKGDVCGKLFWETAYWEHSSELKNRMKEAVLAASKGDFVRMENSHVTPSGIAIIDFSIKPVFNDVGEVTFLIPEGRDVTEMKMAVKSIKEQAELLELTHDAIVVRSTDGLIQFWNHGAEEMYGFSKEEAIGKISHHLLKTIFPESLVQIESELDEQGRWAGELIQTTKSQEQVTVASRWVTKSVADTGQKQVLEISNDITLKKAAERRINEFVSTVSHELRTPLTSINGALRLMKGGVVGDFSVDANEVIDVACGEAQRLIRLVNDMLDLKKIEEGALDLNVSGVKPTSLVALAFDAVRNLAKEQSIELRSELQIDPILMLDQDRIIQVLVNLLSNAIKFSPVGSSIEVKVVQKSPNMLCFSVCDHGQGMVKEDLPKLFARFQQLDSSNARAKGGTGLGLAISKAIVEQHGGTIGDESELGQGSTFWFEVPMNTAMVT